MPRSESPSRPSPPPSIRPLHADLRRPVRALRAPHDARRGRERRRWLGTANPRVGCSRPIHGPELGIEGTVIQRSGRAGHVELRLADADGALCALAQATLIERRE